MANNCFCQVICKYISAITSQEIEVLITHKVLWLFISKINVEILGKFDALSITQYQHYYTSLLTSVLHTYTGIKSIENDQKLQFNEKKGGLELRNTLLQKILEDQ